MTDFNKFKSTSIQTEPTEVSEQAAPAQGDSPDPAPTQEPTHPEPKAEEPAPQQMAAPKPEPAKQTTMVTKRDPMLANSNGLIVAKTLDEEWRICTVMCASKMVPAGFDTPEKVFVGRQFAAELGLPMISALRNICVINGTPSLWGDLPLALVRRSGFLEKFDEYFADKEGNRLKPIGDEGKMFAAVCVIKRKGEQERTYVFTELDVQAARLDTKAIWKLYPRRMRQMRCRGWAIKDVFGDALMGAGIAEYDFDTIPTEGGVFEVDMNADKKKSKLNDSFGSDQGAIPVPEALKG